jgi:hypothetical protein
MFERGTERARAAHHAAGREAVSDGSGFVEPHHLLIGVLLAHPALAREISPSLIIENVCRFLNRHPDPAAAARDERDCEAAAFLRSIPLTSEKLRVRRSGTMDV